MNDYTVQADKFLRDTNSSIKWTYLKTGLYFPEDKTERAIYRWTIRRKGFKSISGRFGQSIAETGGGNTPSDYDLLACIEKYEYLDFNDFCSQLGYDTDSRTACKIFKAVEKQFKKVCSIYSQKEIDLLREIV